MESYRSIFSSIVTCFGKCYIKLVFAKHRYVFFILAFLLIGQHISKAQKIYWVENNAREIQRSNLDGTNVETFFATTSASPSSTNPKGLAIDLVNNYMYWTDFSIERVYRGKIENGTLTGAASIINSTVGDLYGIDLDVKNNQLYFANDYFSEIDMANLDGSGLNEGFISSSGSTDGGIAVDPLNDKIYWTTFSGLERADLSTGANAVTILNLGGEYEDVAVDPNNNKIYYTYIATGIGSIRQANGDGTGDVEILGGLSNEIKGIDIDLKNGKMYWVETGSTPNISRANLDGTSPEIIVSLTAGADPGFIALDNRVETPPKIYWTENVGAIANDDQIHRVGLDGSDFEVIYSGFSDEISGIEIDETNNEIYWTDAAQAEIISGSISEHSTTNNTLIDFNPSGAAKLFDLALDIPNSTVYYTHGNAETGFTNKISMADLSAPDPNTTVVELINTGGEEPFGIDIDLANGKIYYTTNLVATGTDARLYRANMDGTNIEELFYMGTSTVGGTFFRDVKIDPINQRVYWAVGAIDVSPGFIYYNDLNEAAPFASPSSFSFTGEPRGIDLDLINNKIYWVCRGANNGTNPVQIMRADLDGAAASFEIVHVVDIFPSGYPTSPPGSAFIALDLRGLASPPLALTNTTAAKNQTNVSTASNITLSFDQSVAASSVNSTNIIIRGEQTGIITGTLSGGGTNTITFDPANNFKAGEVIRVSLTQGLQSTGGGNLAVSESYQFTTASGTAPETPPFFIERMLTNAADDSFAIFPADIDGDGDMDVAGTAAGTSSIIWFENDGSQNFTERAITNTSSGPTGIIVADLDSDGDLDIIVTSQADARILWFSNDGSQNFTEQTITAGAASPSKLYSIDMEGDGDVDIVSVSFSPTGIAANARLDWYENDGSQSFTQHLLPGINGTSAYPIDVDNDGDIDIVGTSEKASSTFFDKLVWMENDGSQNFTERVVSSVSRIQVDSYATDMDGDGDVDLLMVGSLSFIGWYENDGSQNFTEHEIGSAESQPRAIYATDIDGDGDMDVITAHELLDEVALWINDGSQNFTRQSVTTSADLVWDVYAADMDSDGDMDILSASRFGDEISWYESTLSACASPNPVTAGAVSSTTLQDQSVIADVISGSTIVSGDIIQVAIITQPTNGTVVVNNDNTITYSPNSGYFGSDNFEYSLTNQCNITSSAIVSITITAPPVTNSIIVYNGVSPNGDTFNPYLRIENIETLEPQNKVTVYNRWGDKVFEVDNYNNTDPTKRFNGESDKGKDLPSGVYFYKIEFVSGSQEISGYLTLKR